MKKKDAKYVRYFLTLLLVYGVYTETGKWTALSFLLVFVAIEVTSYLVRKLIEGGDSLLVNNTY